MLLFFLLTRSLLHMSRGLSDFSTCGLCTRILILLLLGVGISHFMPVQRFAALYHDWLMKVLRLIPMDGTFDQTRPLDRLKGVSDVYSLDLKSATDRWPLTLLTVLMTLLLKSRSLSLAITQSPLALNTFVIGKPHIRTD